MIHEFKRRRPCNFSLARTKEEEARVVMLSNNIRSGWDLANKGAVPSAVYLPIGSGSRSSKGHCHCGCQEGRPTLKMLTLTGLLR